MRLPIDIGDSVIFDPRDWVNGFVRDILDRLFPDDVTTSDPTLTTLLLSGGGAKGCFQAGAIGFLASTQDPLFRPKLICGTSVGAINGVLAAENAILGGVERVQTLLRIWLNLETSTDFFDVSPDLARADRDLPSWIKDTTDVSLTELADYMLGEGYGLADSERISQGGFAGGAGGGRVLNKFIKALKYMGGFTIASSIGSSPALLGSTFAGSFLIAQGLKDDVKSILKIRSIYDLAPLSKIIDENLNIETLKLDGQGSSEDFLKTEEVELRLVGNDLRTGNICWMDNRGVLNELPQRTLPRDVYNQPIEIERYQRVYGNLVSSSTGERVELSLFDKIKFAVLGSAAIPVAFPPQAFYTTSEFNAVEEERMTWVDGGVKDLLPTQAAEPVLIQAHENEFNNFVISIHNSPQYPLSEDFFRDRERWLKESEHPDTYNPKPQYWDINQDDARNYGYEERGDDIDDILDSSGTGILGIAKRSYDMTRQEVDRTDRLDLLALSIPFQEMLISPSFGVNGTAQIDRGLTRIQLAYGWMRAADMAFLKHNRDRLEAGEEANLSPFFRMYVLSDEITRLRMNSWRHEMRFLLQRRNAEPQVLWGNGAIAIIRNAKRLIAERIRERQALASEAGFPFAVFPDPTFMLGESEDAWLDFELHSHKSMGNYGPDDDDPARQASAYLNNNRADIWAEQHEQQGALSTVVPAEPRPDIGS
jgi:predicted acylesterase/phospholipase RssA